MKTATFHLGPMDDARARCIEQQVAIYGKSHEVFTSWPGWFKAPDVSDIRYAKDLFFLELMARGYFVMDSDVVPKYKFTPTLAGVWVPHNLGRVDYYMGAAVGKDGAKYVDEMLADYKANPEAHAFKWQAQWFLLHPSKRHFIPIDSHEHLFLTTNKGATA